MGMINDIIKKKTIEIIDNLDNKNASKTNIETVVEKITDKDKEKINQQIKEQNAKPQYTYSRFFILKKEGKISFSRNGSVDVYDEKNNKVYTVKRKGIMPFIHFDIYDNNSKIALKVRNKSGVVIAEKNSFAYNYIFYKNREKVGYFLAHSHSFKKNPFILIYNNWKLEKQSRKSNQIILFSNDTPVVFLTATSSEFEEGSIYFNEINEGIIGLMVFLSVKACRLYEAMPNKG